MWQNFTEGTRHAMIRAQKAASDRSENIVKPEHLLIGLLAEPHSAAYRLLQGAGVTVSDLAGHLEGILTPGPGRDGTDLRLDPSARRAIDLAWNEARRLRRNYIGTEHLILGILAADTGATGITFRHFALDLDKGRTVVDSLDGFYPSPSLADTGTAAVAYRQAEPGGNESSTRRKELLPGILLGVMFTVVILMLRGCG